MQSEIQASLEDTRSNDLDASTEDLDWRANEPAAKTQENLSKIKFLNSPTHFTGFKSK